MAEVRLRAAPIASMIAVATTVALIIVAISAALRGLPTYDNLMGESSWAVAHLVHVPQFLIPFLLICYITKGRLAEYGFNLKEAPPVFTHRRMLGIGVFCGLVMSLKYLSQVVEGAPLDIPRPVTLVNVLGHMTFQWVVVGVSEETMFRGLIQTYLMDHLEGHARLLGHDLHLGTLVGAIIWGAFHLVNLLVLPLETVVFFVLVTTAMGLPMGYAYQETGSLLTTVIVHNTIFGVPLTVGYILHWLLH